MDKAVPIISMPISLSNMSQEPLFLPLELEPLAYPFLCILLNLSIMVLEKFYPKRLAYLHFLFHKKDSSRKIIDHEDEKKINETKPKAEVYAKDLQINREETLFVIEKMGLSVTKGDPIKDLMENNDFSRVFEDLEPSLDEIGEAFSVFDRNKDGFFDAEDLQRVFSSLGIKEGAELKVCELMIEQHDRNGDGLIDLRDFSTLLEMSLW